MADTGEARLSARDAVVRPLSRAAGRPCARPGCPSPARATLSFRYATREAWLEAIGDEPSLATYDLCSQHADKTRPPHGWDLVDRRPAEDETTVTVAPEEIGGEHTVAVLAAALRAVPDAPAPVSAAPVPDVPAAAPAVEAPAATQPVLLDDDVQSALAELQAVAQGPDDLERIEVEAELADEVEVLVHAVEELEAATPEPATSGAAPRPVPAARDRHRDEPGGTARSW